MKKSFWVLGLVGFIGFVFMSGVLAEDMKFGWGNFNDGSSSTYEMQGGMKQKQTLISKTETEATVKYDTIMNGEVVSSMDLKIPLKPQEGQATGEKVDVKETIEDVAVGSQTISCKVYESDTAQGKNKSYMSDKVPGGIVKSEFNGSVSMILVEFEAK